MLSQEQIQKFVRKAGLQMTLGSLATFEDVVRIAAHHNVPQELQGAIDARREHLTRMVAPIDDDEDDDGWVEIGPDDEDWIE